LPAPTPPGLACASLRCSPKLDSRGSGLSAAEACAPALPSPSQLTKRLLRRAARRAGEASAIFKRAEANAKGLQLLADAIRQQGGSEAVSLRVAEQYLDSFGEIAKRGTTMLLPAATHDPASMVASALSIYKQVSGSSGAAPPPPAGAAPAPRPAPRPVPPNPQREAPAAAAAPAGHYAAGGPRFTLQRVLE
jgi:hypothetical protein